jgi:hypothetical protein
MHADKRTALRGVSALSRTGWAQAACAGDFDNDGNSDLLLTYYGTNILPHLGNGKLESCC